MKILYIHEFLLKEIFTKNGDVFKLYCVLMQSHRRKKSYFMIRSLLGSKWTRVKYVHDKSIWTMAYQRRYGY